MLQLSTIYHDEEKLTSFLYQNSFNLNTPCFVRIFTTFTSDELINAHVQSIKSVLPKAIIFGATSAFSLMHNTKQYNDATLILINTFDKLVVKAHSLCYTDLSYKEIAKQLYEFHNPKCENNIYTHIFVSKNTWLADYFITEINALPAPLCLVGGIVEKVFTDAGVLKDTILSFSLQGKDVNHFTYPSAAAEIISPPLRITQTSDHTYIEEIEGIPTKKWLYDYFDIQKEEGFTLDNWPEQNISNYLNHFPVITKKYENARYIYYQENTGKFSLFSSEVLNNMEFRMAYVTPKKVMDETYKACTQILSSPVESIFIYSCYIRKISLQNCAQWELSPYDGNNVAGIFLYGEICYYQGKNAFYNGTCCITGFAENERYILPDITAIKKKATLNKQAPFYKKALEKQKQTSAKQTILLKSVSCDINSESCRDQSIGLPNLFQYEDDLEADLFDKIALVEILTADPLIAFLGQQKYNKTRSVVSQTFEDFIIKHNMQDYTKVYSLNYKTFIIAASPTLATDTFTVFMQTLYSRIEHSFNEEDLEDVIVRIAVCHSQDNMIQVAMNTLFTKKDSQDSFILCNDEQKEEEQDNNDLQRIELIKKALEHDLIVPFYQGIRNNQSKSIEKYESLMRIIDENGKIFYPDYFLTVAKKYKFYNRLSKNMIEKALSDFEDKEESISINISLYDVESASFRNWLLRRLANYPHPERVVIELVESESFRSSELMRNFIHTVHEVGSKVAIDDFGAGYSTFLTIAQVRPDFIKIDGSIIKEILHDETSLILVETIAQLAQRLGTQTIAEFVDNEDVQAILEKNNINYSQGFYFAKPAPLHELNLLKQK